MLPLSLERSVNYSHPEPELLVRLARVDVDSGMAERIRGLLQQRIDWEYLLPMAYRNGVAPLLYWNLNKICPEAAPEGAWLRLRQHFHDNARRNLLRARELLILLNALKACGARAVPLKGPVLAISVYGLISLREFTDLDILIHERDATNAREVLRSLGYQPRRSSAPFETGHLIKSEPASVFERADGMISLDVHWRLTRKALPFDLDGEPFWDRLVEVNLAGETLLSTPPEDLILILCMHGSRHFWSRLAWVCDIAELLRVHGDMDWERVEDQARVLGSDRMLLLGLLLASDLLGAPVPGDVLRRARSNRKVTSLAGVIRDQLFAERRHEMSTIRKFAFRMTLGDSLGARVSHLRFIARRAVTPTERDRTVIRLPVPLSFTYYLIRPIRVAGSYATRWVRRAPTA